MASERRAEELKRLTLLYAEDEQGIRDEVAHFLGRHVGRLLVAADGAEAWRLYLAQRPDLVLSDIQMPVMDGLALAEGIRQQHPDVPVILTTAFNDTSYLQRAIAIGACGYALKPIHLDQLMQTILRCVGALVHAREITTSRAQLAAYHKAAEEERQLVADLMARMMRPENLRDSQVRYWLRPAEVVGGDLIAVARSRSDKLYVMLADSTGHGLPAALNLLPINHIFYRMVSKGLPVALIVEEMNWAVREQSPTERYVSALVACIDTRNRVLEVWNGGLPGAFCIADDGCVCRTFESANFPLGVLDRTFTAQTEIYQWNIRGHLVMYSDGLEDVENADGVTFGSQGIVAAVADTAAEERFDALVAAAQAHLGAGHAFDDITLMMVSSEAPA